MKYFLRLFWLVLTQARRPRCPVLGPCTSPFRVWPNDLDLFMHVNNGAYLTLADLGRMDLLLRSDAFWPIKRRGWYPVVTAETIQFRRSLRLFERYTIRTRIVGWDDRSTYIEQVFEKPGSDGAILVAKALIEARFLSTEGEKISTDVLFAAMQSEGLLDAGASEQSPDLPDWAQTWVLSLQQLRSEADLRTSV